MSVFGGETWNWIKPILAFSTFLTFPAAFSWNTNPSMSSVSSTVPPNFLMTLMSFKFKKKLNCYWFHEIKKKMKLLLFFKKKYQLVIKKIKRVRNFKKVRAENLVKWGESISRNFFLDFLDFLYLLLNIRIQKKKNFVKMSFFWSEIFASCGH